jgi:phosphate transport system substrate-binding protein
MKKIFVLSLASILFLSQNSLAREQIRVVGSSTVYPFVTVIAEEFGTKTDFRTPIIESTGTGGGFKLFCSGLGDQTPDIANASRKMKDSEQKACSVNGVKNIIELKLGYDGIVIANSSKAKLFDVTKKELFLALAKYVPEKGKLVLNKFKNWKEINKDLPDQKIEVYGPPPTSGTRDAFVEIVMDEACIEITEFKTAYPDEEIRKKECQQIREDGIYIESGENDNLIVQKLKNNEKALGIFGYSFLEQNAGEIQGSKVNGVEPDFDNIANGKYPVSRSLYLYVKGDHFGKVDGLKEFLNEIVSEDATGEEGYLATKGLIPLKEEEIKSNREKVSKL